MLTSFYRPGRSQPDTKAAACEEQHQYYSCFRASYQHKRRPWETQLSRPTPGNPALWFCEQSGRSVWSEEEREENVKRKSGLFHCHHSSLLSGWISGVGFLIPGEAVRRDKSNISQGKQIAQIETSTDSSHGGGFGRRGAALKIPNRRRTGEWEREREKWESQVRKKKMNQLQKRRMRMGKAHE